MSNIREKVTPQERFIIMATLLAGDFWPQEERRHRRNMEMFSRVQAGLKKQGLGLKVPESFIPKDGPLEPADPLERMVKAIMFLAGRGELHPEDWKKLRPLMLDLPTLAPFGKVSPEMMVWTIDADMACFGSGADE